MTSLRQSHSVFPRAFRLEVVVVLLVLVLVLGLTPPPSALAAGAWTPTGSLQTGRVRHTATRLANGKVLVAGGGYGNSFLVSAEVYDPATGQWSPTVSLDTVRTNHTATLLANGQVLVAGGTNLSSDALSSAELYLKVLTAYLWTATGDLVTPRTQHTATLLNNGKVLAVGGSGPDSQGVNTAELYNPAFGSWAAFPGPRRVGHTATLLANGKVLVAGGTGGTVISATSAQVYDHGTGAWTPTGSLKTARMLHTATLLIDGRVLVAAGTGEGGALSSAELYQAVGNVGTYLLMLLGD